MLLISCCKESTENREINTLNSIMKFVNKDYWNYKKNEWSKFCLKIILPTLLTYNQTWGGKKKTSKVTMAIINVTSFLFSLYLTHEEKSRSWKPVSTWKSTSSFIQWWVRVNVTISCQPLNSWTEWTWQLISFVGHTVMKILYINFYHWGTG